MGDTDSLEKNRVRDVMDADSSGQHSGIIMHTRYDHNRPTFQTLPSWATETTDYPQRNYTPATCNRGRPPGQSLRSLPAPKEKKALPTALPYFLSSPRSAPIDPEKSL